ncbi:fatty-acid amide hydrolase 2-A-like [Plodia interpunctella]|uniref:fatty-acid amide hydrolase 2-A-like n=1 Tax=Plodia interpunctella TaxID=58824 RepID=UPI002368C5A7|nr:fatty-acid amide hydrolase 2-A-like [Plodia interpunctella]XP_053611014.1 fatty-acid amide hydrolase 2-A-like [Plodia interpunctella]
MCTKEIEKKPIIKERRKKTNKIVRGMAFNVLKHSFLLFRSILDWVIDLVFSFYWESKRQPIPALDKRHSLLAESAVTLAAKIRNKELTSEELVNICIERIKLVNPILNAVTDERFEAALTDAREVDRQIAEGLSKEDFDKKPFLGVPFTAKESTAVEGMINSLGLRSRRHSRADRDAECVRLLRLAGAIPVAVTNVPEVNKWQECRNMVFGQTNNPYHSGRSAGGSSGGEAALAAALAAPVALCSDIGGSTRMPGFYCGLYALNPTAGCTNLRGLALRTGQAPTMASISFVSRHIQDLAPLTKVVAGDKASQLGFDKPVDIKNVKVFYTETAQDLRVSPISSELRQAMKRAISKLAEVAPSTASGPKPYYHHGFDYMYSLWRHAMTKEVDSFPKLLANNKGEAKAIVELPKKLLGQSEFTLAAILKLVDEQILPQVNEQWADKLTDELKEDLLHALGTDGVLLFPSAPTVAPYHYSLLLKPFHFAHWGIFNVLKLPAAQVPLGLNKDGIPLGIQVVAGPYQESLCLAVAEYLGRHVGGYVPPCNVH